MIIIIITWESENVERRKFIVLKHIVKTSRYKPNDEMMLEISLFSRCWLVLENERLFNVTGHNHLNYFVIIRVSKGESIIQTST